MAQNKKYGLIDLLDRNQTAQVATPTATRQSATDVVNSWSGNGTKLTDEAVNSYTNKVQALYDSEAQQRASADANFQKSLRYIPQMYKAAGLQGSGQSESILNQMAAQQTNTQNDITAETNKAVNELQDKYTEAIQVADAEEKAKVDEIANYISNIDFSNYTGENYQAFVDYLKSADYTDEQINSAISQIKAFKPEVYNVVNNLRNTQNQAGTSDIKGGNLLDANALAAATIIDQPAKPINGADLVRNGRDFTVEYNGQEYRLEGRKVVDSDMQARLNAIARQANKSIEAGRVLYVDGEFYVYDGRADKGWRKADNVGFEITDIIQPIYTPRLKRNQGTKLKKTIQNSK